VFAVGEFAIAQSSTNRLDGSTSPRGFGSLGVRVLRVSCCGCGGLLGPVFAPPVLRVPMSDVLVGGSEKTEVRSQG